MQITEVRIKLMDDPSDRLCAFCSITLDECFVIRDLKIIQGAKGVFVAMPSRKLTDRCPKCQMKNALRSHFCSNCGVRLHSDRANKDDDGRAKLYADIAHPINSECRDQIQQMVITSYEEELIKSQQVGYICTYDDFEEDRYASLNDYHEDGAGSVRVSPSSSVPPDRESQPAGESGLRLETEDGKVLRVDAAERNDNTAKSNASETTARESAPVTARPGSQEGFGEGII